MYFTRQPQTTHPNGGADLSNCKPLDLSTLQPHTHMHKDYKKACHWLYQAIHRLKKK